MAINSPAAGGRVDQRRHRHPGQHHRRPRPDAGRGQRGLQPDPGGGRPRRQHHLRLGDRPQLRRRGAHHRDRHRLHHPGGDGDPPAPGGGRAAPGPRSRPRRHRWPRRARRAPGLAPDAAADVRRRLGIDPGAGRLRRRPAGAGLRAGDGHPGARLVDHALPAGAAGVALRDGQRPGSGCGARRLRAAGVVHARAADRARGRGARAGVGAPGGAAQHPSAGGLAAVVGPGPGGPGGNRRSAAGGQPSLGGDELGIEESEYDTPAYLRRSRGGAGHASAGGTSAQDYAAMGYRMPEGK